ncbi:MAG TPA: LacI family transcriptional regulator, partial [Clostridiales bacterium]|nr:LacI family transcriptional regulator [Clostridiales bacterium]
PASEAPASEAPASEAPAAAGGSWKIAVVPKMTSIAWFERMENGVKMYNEQYSDNIFYGGSVEGADQAAYVESLLAEEWDAICVTPFDTEAMEPVLEKARAQGIIVITHEAANMANIDYDVEALDNIFVGELMMQNIGEHVGGTGKYIQLVGALTSQTHMEWTGGAEEYQKANYPDMELIGKYETKDDQEEAYNQAKEALTANPDIVAIQGSASTDVAGAARAVEELGLAGKVTLVGFSLWSVSGQYVEDGVITGFYFWDSAYAAMAQITIAKAMLDGTIADIEANGIADTYIQGYQEMTLQQNDAGRPVFYAQSYVYIDETNVADETYHY